MTVYIPRSICIASEGKPSPRRLEANAVTTTSDDLLKQRIIALFFQVQTPFLQDVAETLIRMLPHSVFENVKLKV